VVLSLLAGFAVALYLSGEALGGTGGGREAGLTPEGPGAINHPVGMEPSTRVRIPADWPLSRDGRVTCWTCHASIPDANAGADFGLRGAPDRSGTARFCAACHQVSGPENDRSHWMALQRAHIGSGEATARSAGTLDSVSRRCASCHDGVSAFESGYHGGAEPPGGGYPGDPRRDHPVGVIYRATAFKGTTGLKPEGFLPPSVLLPGGQVTCISCHNLYSRAPGLLSVPIEGSQLCFACHDMD
jgi:predicted CXXCH cytochrome family protein